MPGENLAAVPSVEGAMRNPDNLNHFMVAKPVERRVRVFLGDKMLAETSKALRLVEIGKAAYDPLLYIPMADVILPLEPMDKTTHCPLKGDANYFSFEGNEISWSYLEPFEFSKAIKGHHAFWPSKVRIEEGE